jgi:hypothetical protein
MLYHSLITHDLMGLVISYLISLKTVLFLTWVRPFLLQIDAAHRLSGPKMYIAYGHEQNHLCHGSTRLHLDVTSAINILLYAVDRRDGSPGGAVWHIFAPEVASELRKFMRNEPIAFKGRGDPIHDQATYLTPHLLQALDRDHGIRPYIIRQQPGDAVYIPAGCAHQVRSASVCCFA